MDEKALIETVTTAVKDAVGDEITELRDELASVKERVEKNEEVPDEGDLPATKSDGDEGNPPASTKAGTKDPDNEGSGGEAATKGDDETVTKPDLDAFKDEIRDELVTALKEAASKQTASKALPDEPPANPEPDKPRRDAMGRRLANRD